MLASIPCQESTSIDRPRDTATHWNRTRFLSYAITAIAIVGLLAFLSWRELTAEFDASITQYARSFDHHGKKDRQ
jgi:hypothetical protein